MHMCVVRVILGPVERVCSVDLWSMCARGHSMMPESQLTVLISRVLVHSHLLQHNLLWSSLVASFWWQNPIQYQHQPLDVTAAILRHITEHNLVSVIIE